MGALVGALLTAGPSLIRAAGSLIGGSGKDVADKAADAVEAASGGSDPQSELEKHLASLSPEQITALNSVKTKLAEIEADRQKTQIQAGVSDRAEVNKTMRAELSASNAFKSGWRAAIGWVMALSFLLMTGAMCWAVIQDPTQLPSAVSGVMTMAVAMAAVLGVNISRDGRAREAAITGQPAVGVIDAIAHRVKNGGK